MSRSLSIHGVMSTDTTAMTRVAAHVTATTAYTDQSGGGAGREGEGIVTDSAPGIGSREHSEGAQARSFPRARPRRGGPLDSVTAGAGVGSGEGGVARLRDLLVWAAVGAAYLLAMLAAVLTVRPLPLGGSAPA